jgi:hypothetical protein
MNTMRSRDVMTGLASPIDFPEEAWPDSMGDFIQWGKLRADLRHALPWLLPVILLGLWQLSSSYGWLPVSVLPAPLDVLKAAWHLAI